MPWDSPPSREAGARVAHCLTACATSSGRHDPTTDTLIPFDTTNVTSRHNRSRPEPGDPCHTLASGQHPPAIAYQCHGSNVGPMGTLRAGNGNVSGGVPFVVTGTNKTARVAFGAEVAGCLRTKPPESIENSSTTVVACPRGVRRLTPKECERLQGFPDDWTAGESDSARYRMLGNAVSPEHSFWIGKRIKQAS